MNRPIDPARLASLIRHVAEFEDFVAGEAPAIRFPSRPRVRVHYWVTALAAAAALLFALLPSWSDRIQTLPPTTVVAPPERPRTPLDIRPAGDLFVLVAFQSWRQDCFCDEWNVRELLALPFPLMQPFPAESEPLANSGVAADAPVERPIGQAIFAVARRSSDPTALQATCDDIASCLNAHAPCAESSEAPQVYAAAVEKCLPALVSVMSAPAE